MPTKQETDLAKTIATLVTATSQDPAKVLERALRLARGTRDGLVPMTDTRAKVERALRDHAPRTLREIAAATHEPAGRVADVLRKMRGERCPTRSRDDAPEARQIYNAGTPDEPRWFWVIGDETSPEDLTTAVRRLIGPGPHARAMTFSELTLATGARRGRLSGRLVQMQRDGEPLENVGDSERIYRWRLKRAGR